MTTVLSQLVIKNAVDLLSKSAKQRHAAGAAALGRVGPQIDPTEMVSALETAVKDDINTLAVEHPDLSIAVSDRVVAGATDAEQVTHETVIIIIIIINAFILNVTIARKLQSS